MCAVYSFLESRFNSKWPREKEEKNEDIEAESTYCYDFPNLHLCEAEEKKKYDRHWLISTIDFRFSFIHLLLCLHLPSLCRIWIIASGRSSSSCVCMKCLWRSEWRRRTYYGEMRTKPFDLVRITVLHSIRFKCIWMMRLNVPFYPCYINSMNTRSGAESFDTALT